MRGVIYTSVALAVICAAAPAEAPQQFRFPMPEFSTDYHHPDMHTPPPAWESGALDVAILAAALALAAWLVLKKRSRAGVLALTIFSLVYFGFYREGCICPVGSVQNVTAAAIDPTFPISFAVVAFFLLPLIFALFFGRVFCAAVCPLGAIQEVVAVRPVAIPLSVERLLRLIPYIYLGLTVLGVATGAGFLICRYDPFVGFFRLGASFNMFLVGAILLLLGIFVGRPYCRFLCPYGVLLGWMSRFSKWHASITPDECIQCRLCEDSCPYGAINEPTPEEEPAPRREGAKRLGTLLLLTPLIIAAGGFVGAVSHPFLARLHPTVRLAERIAQEEEGRFEEMTLESEAFRAGSKTIPELYDDARGVRGDFKYKSIGLGAFLGLVVAGHLLGLSVIRKRTDYETDRTACVSCARCFAYCPVEDKQRRGKSIPSE